MTALTDSDLRKRQAEFAAAVDPLPGSQPYTNRRPMNVAGRFDGLTLAEFLRTLHPHRNAEHWRKAVEEGRLSVDGVLVRDLNRQVRAGNRLEHAIPNTVEPTVNADVHFLHEDEAILVLRKPAPLPMHPCGRYNLNSLVPLLTRAFPEIGARPVHRLDADTTGVVVLAKTRDAARSLGRQFESRTVTKTYLALVDGRPAWECFEGEAEFSAGPSAGGKREVVLEGKRAETSFEVLAEHGGRTLLRVSPRSGRTNQIRLQLAALGLPIVGDRAYGEDASALEAEGEPMSGEGELCLHAWRLAFSHPTSGEALRFEAALPSWGRAFRIG